MSYNLTESSLLAGKTGQAEQAELGSIKTQCPGPSSVFYMVYDLNKVTTSLCFHFLICKMVSLTSLGAAVKIK